jgi:DNA-directed RNA polymerase subunit K/omega
MSDAGDDEYAGQSDVADEEPDALEGEDELVDPPDVPEPLYGMRQADQKVTLPLMTRFELARVIGVRAQQISLGAPLCLPVKELGNADDPIAIATLEVTKKALPFVIRRYLPHGVSNCKVPLSSLPLGVPCCAAPSLARTCDTIWFEASLSAVHFCLGSLSVLVWII